MTAYRVEVLASGESTWATNAMEYDSEDDAKRAGSDLADRWLAVVDWRVVPTTTPRRQQYTDTGPGEWGKQ